MVHGRSEVEAEVPQRLSIISYLSGRSRVYPGVEGAVAVHVTLSGRVAGTEMSLFGQRGATFLELERATKCEYERPRAKSQLIRAVKD